MRLAFRNRGDLAQIASHLPRTGIHRILICRSIKSLGNSLLLTPLLQELGKFYPGAEIDLVARSPIAQDIYGAYFSVSRIIQLPRAPLRHPLQTFRALREMKRKHYDLVIDPDPDSQSGRLLALRANATWSLGFVGPKKSGTLTHGIVLPDELRHHAKIPVALVRNAIGDGIRNEPYPPLDIRLSAIERHQGRAALAHLAAGHPASLERRPCIGLFANATGAKRFGHAWWARFLHAFEPGVADYDLVEILPAFGQSLLDSRYPAYFSSEVRKLACVIGALDIFVSADCGVMHLACAAGTPTAGIFAVTDVNEWGPYGPSSCAIDAQNLAPEQAAQRVLEFLRGLPGANPRRIPLDSTGSAASGLRRERGG
ncbi:MAG: glycosyltransferase family 9 protein [Rhodanobacteraceae bacterium]